MLWRSYPTFESAIIHIFYWRFWPRNIPTLAYFKIYQNSYLKNLHGVYKKHAVTPFSWVLGRSTWEKKNCPTEKSKLAMCLNNFDLNNTGPSGYRPACIYQEHLPNTSDGKETSPRNSFALSFGHLRLSAASETRKRKETRRERYSSI